MKEINKIFILLGTNDQKSFSKSVFDYTVDFHQNLGREVRVIEFSEGDFDPDLTNGYKKRKPFEPVVQAFVDNYIWCDKLIMIYPIWWGMAPAKLKGLIDRAVLPGVLVEKSMDGPFKPPMPIYKGKRVQVISLLHAPKPITFFMPNNKAIKYPFRMGLHARVKINYVRVKNELSHDEAVQKAKKYIK
jgi:NAD(P)H dehydrogenase (quinone)